MTAAGTTTAEREHDRPTTVPGRPAVRLGPVSVVWRPRTAAVLLGLAVLTLGLVVLSTALGEYALPPGDVLRVLLGGGDRMDRLVVVDLRLPRVVTGLGVGAALGISGAVVQSLARNALASPDVLGVSQGASAAAVLAILVGGGSAGLLGTTSAALAGGLLTAALVYGLAWRGGVSGFRLVLVGIGVAAAASALTSWLLVSAQINNAAVAVVWLTGSLESRTWSQALTIAATVAVLGTATVAGSATLGALRLGDDTVRSLGVRVQVTRGALLLAAVVLAAVATAAAGPIAFVALVAPQVALRLVRSAGPPVATSAVLGAALVLGADLVARTVLPVALPVGVVTAAIGGPFLIALLVKRNRESTL